MYIKSTQAKILGVIVLIAVIIVVAVSVSSLRISADSVVSGAVCPAERTLEIKDVARKYGLFNYRKIKELVGTVVKPACVTSINPTKIALGEIVTITGSNFSTDQNNFILTPIDDRKNPVRFIKGSVKSNDGTTLKFDMPKDIYGRCGFFGRICREDIALGQYELQVDPTGPFANKSNLYPITIVSQPAQATNISLLPSSGLVGVSVTLTANTDDAFSAEGNSINFNNSKDTIVNLDSSDGKTLTFNIPSNTSSLDGANTNEYSDFPILPGVYTISATNRDGITTNIQNFTVTKKPATVDTTTNNAPSNTDSTHIDSTQNSGQTTN